MSTKRKSKKSTSAEPSPDTVIKPSDLRAQAEELIRQGKMPSLADVTKAVAETREEYAIRFSKSEARTRRPPQKCRRTNKRSAPKKEQKPFDPSSLTTRPGTDWYTVVKNPGHHTVIIGYPTPDSAEPTK
jgi:hypothetical protein